MLVIIINKHNIGHVDDEEEDEAAASAAGFCKRARKYDFSDVLAFFWQRRGNSKSSDSLITAEQSRHRRLTPNIKYWTEMVMIRVKRPFMTFIDRHPALLSHLGHR